MFNKYLEMTNKKTANYFDNLFQKFFNNKKNMPNSIILWGSDSIVQYIFALEIARNLNCLKDKESDCDCLNCKWIKSNSHPDIITVSKINYKPESDTTKVISLKQIHSLIDEINFSSEAYRVVIFCDADYEFAPPDLKRHIENFSDYINIFEKKGEKYWIPKPLSQKVFQDTSTNALLKTIEETPENLLFIFLTSSPDDLISTIISRSQTFYIQNSYTPNYNYDFCKDIFLSYKNMDKDDFDEFTSKSMNYMQNFEVKMFDFLELMQAYFTKMLSENSNDEQLKQKILLTIKYIIEAKKQDGVTIKPQYILDNLWIKIAEL